MQQPISTAGVLLSLVLMFAVAAAITSAQNSSTTTIATTTTTTLAATTTTTSVVASSTTTSASPATNTTTACELPACCNETMRNTLDPLTNFPYCFKVGLLIDQGDTARYLGNTIPYLLWNASTTKFPQMAIFPIQTDLGYDPGLDAMRRGDFDVYIADVWSLSRRTKGLDWGLAYTREFIGLGFVVPSPPPASFLALFEPFDELIWWLALLLLILGAILLFVVEFMHPVSYGTPPPGGRLVYRFAFMRSFLRCADNAFKAPFGSGRFMPVSTAGALVVFGLKFFMVIFNETYTAVLTSFLTVSGAQAQISLPSLLSKGIMAPGGGNANVDFAQAAGGKTMILNSTNANPSPAMLKKVLEGPNPDNIASFVQGSALLFRQTDKDCDTRFMRLPFFIDTVLTFRQHPAVARVRRAVDQTVVTLKQNGTINQMFSRAYLPESARCPHARTASDEIVEDLGELRLDLDNMMGLFVIIIALLLLAIVAAAVLRLLAHCWWGTPNAEEQWAESSPELNDMSEEPSGVLDLATSGSNNSNQQRGRNQQLSSPYQLNNIHQASTSPTNNKGSAFLSPLNASSNSPQSPGLDNSGSSNNLLLPNASFAFANKNDSFAVS